MQEKNGDDQKKEGGGLSWSTPPAAARPAPAPTPVAPAAAPAPKAPSVASNAPKYAGMVVAGVIAGVVIAWGFIALRTPSNDNAPAATDTASGTPGTSGADTSPATGSDPSLTVLSPQPAGTSVAISKAIVSSPTWVVIYENKDGKPGNALGAALFFPERQAGTVELLRATAPGKSYLAVKQVDNGDRKFSLKADQYLSEGGEVQWVTFETK